MKNATFSRSYDHPLELNQDNGQVSKFVAYLPATVYPEVDPEHVKAARGRGVTVESVSAADKAAIEASAAAPEAAPQA